MNQQDQHFDGSWIETDSENKSEPVSDEIENTSMHDVAIVTKQFQKSVSDVLSATGDVGLTQSIVKNALKQNWNGPKETGSMLEPMPSRDTTKSNTEIVPVNLPEKSNTTPSTVSKPLFETSSEAASDSLSLLTDTSRHLFDLMKSVTGPLPQSEEGNPFKAIEVERVNAAAGCAKQLYSIMRLKLDAIKLIRETK